MAGKKLLEFSDEEDEKLIELVGNHPPLYNPELEVYKDINVRDNIWKNIAKVLNKTDADVKKRWKYIRDSYNRFKRKKIMTTGSAAPSKKSKWQFFERLNFLEQTRSERESYCSVESSANPVTSDGVPTEGTQQISQDQQPVVVTEEGSQYSTNATVPSIKKRRKKTQDEFITSLQKRNESQQLLLEELGNQNTTLHSSVIETEDDITSFANNVKHVLRKLNPRLKVLAKSETFNLLTKYEMMEMETHITRPLTKTSTSNDSPFSPISVNSPPSNIIQPTDLTTQTQQEQNEVYAYHDDIITT